eukprot:g2443.t1
MRFLAGIRYVGTNYHGWDSGHKSSRSIRCALEEALHKFAPFSDRHIIGTSRTDAGVHAIRNVASFDIERRDKRGEIIETPYSTDEVLHGMNYWLRKNSDTFVCVTDVEQIPPQFHPRHNATERQYLYRIVEANKYSGKPLFEVGRAWITYEALDIERMKIAAEMLTGTMDFSSFRSSGCQSTQGPHRTVTDISVEAVPDTVNDLNIIQVYTRAPSFMYHQVRNMVGALQQVGCWKISIEELSEIIEAKERQKAPAMAPACGLYLQNVIINNKK